MRVLVCGDRNWLDEQIVEAVLDGFAGRTGCGGESATLTVIEGGARGADSIAAAWAKEAFAQCGCKVGHERFPADWDKHGKAAGPIRNQRMLDEGKPDVVLAFHDDLSKSKGTADMVRRAKDAGIPVYIIGRYR